MTARALRERRLSWGRIAAMLHCTREQARRAAAADTVPRAWPTERTRKQRRTVVNPLWSALLAMRAAQRHQSRERNR